jgi:DNA polymerase/3'-5' exonuclease PolX
LSGALSTAVRARLSKVPAEFAAQVARDYVDALEDNCERICIAGSLRRRKLWVSDIEIIFVAKLAPDPERDDFFKPKDPVNLTERALDRMLEARLIEKRPNVNGVCSWGPDNKLGRDPESGLAIDLFTATRENWFNYLVCRTGGAESNVRIASAAISKGWKWNPYGPGFSRGSEKHVITSEREVFEFVGLRYQEPWQR